MIILDLEQKTSVKSASFGVSKSFEVLSEVFFIQLSKIFVFVLGLGFEEFGDAISSEQNSNNLPKSKIINQKMSKFNLSYLQTYVKYKLIHIVSFVGFQSADASVVIFNHLFLCAAGHKVNDKFIYFQSHDKHNI